MYKKIVTMSLVAGTLVAMNGCGGGGSPSSTVESAALKGVAVDDLILNGIVQAKDTAGNLLSEGRTSITDGSYTLNVTHTGVVIVNASCDENSTLYNPVTDLNSTCGDDVSLNSIATIDEAGQEVTVNISPLTEVVYDRAVALAGDDVSSITNDDFDIARAEIGVMLSVDPIGDDPLSDDYADIIDVIHTIADDSDSSIMEITDALSDALSDGSADGEPIIMDFVAEMDESNLTNNLVEDNGTYTPPEDIAQLSDIDAAKELFTELRTQAMSVTDYTNSGTPGFLDNEAMYMEMALSDVVLDISFIEFALNYQSDVESFMRDSNLTVHTVPIGQTRTLTITLTGPSSYDYVVEQNDSTWGGTVSYPMVNEPSDIYTFTTLTAQVDGTFPLGYEYEIVPDGVEDSQSFNGTITATKTTSGANLELNGEVASNGTSLIITDATAEIAYEEDTTTGEPILNYFKFNSATLQGIVGGYTIDGSITVNSYVQNAGLAVKGGIEEIAETFFYGQAYCSGGGNGTTPYANALVQITLDGLTHNVYTDSNGWYNGQIPGAYDINAFEYALSGSDASNYVTLDDSVCPVGSTASTFVQGAFIDSYENIANSGWLPNDVTFTGAISRTGASIEGTLNAKWLNAATIDVENSLDVPFLDVTLNGKLQMPELPEMLMSLSYENNVTHNTLGASYTYDATVINANGVFDANMSNGDVEITTHTGIRADIDVSNGSIVYGGASNVTKDGLLIGEFEDREGLPVIKYTDGSFESIF